jgi:uncharacterized DUF497 family protein
MDFEWHDSKDALNITKHGLSFYEAQEAFFDKSKVIIVDKAHSSIEKRYFCIGKIPSGDIVTVRFTNRNGRIRIIGAGYWRKGRKIYEKHK